MDSFAVIGGGANGPLHSSPSNAICGTSLALHGLTSAESGVDISLPAVGDRRQLIDHRHGPSQGGGDGLRRQWFAAPWEGGEAQSSAVHHTPAAAVPSSRIWYIYVVYLPCPIGTGKAFGQILRLELCFSSDLLSESVLITMLITESPCWGNPGPLCSSRMLSTEKKMLSTEQKCSSHCSSRRF